MKRMIAAAILLIFVATVYITGFFYIKNTCEKAENLLTKCNQAFEEDKEAQKQVKNLENLWDKSEKVLSVFSNHKLIDEIELAIYALKTHTQKREEAMFYEYSSKIKTMLHQMMEDTMPSIHSIF